MSARAATILEDFAEILTEISVDGMLFRVTWNPVRERACILWLRRGGEGCFEALGQFDRFEKRSIIEFIAGYVTCTALRREVERRRFEARVGTLSPAFFEDLGRMAGPRRKMVYKSLFSLDSMVEQPPLDVKRRIMARRFHPDAGGDNRSMALINEAYEYLASRFRR